MFLVVIYAQKGFSGFHKGVFPFPFTMSDNVVDLETTAASCNNALMAKHMQPVVETSLARSSHTHETQSAAFNIAKKLERSDSEKTLKLGDPVPESKHHVPLAFKPSTALEKFLPRALPAIRFCKYFSQMISSWLMSP